MGRPVALTVAGSDSGGGAGLVADVKTFAARGVWASVAITAVTAQNARSVQRVSVLEPSLVRAQIESVAAGMAVAAAKTGMLGSAAVAEVVAEVLRPRGWPLVVDPVLVSTSGTALLGPGGVEVVRDRLLPLAWVVTPNLAEAAVLTGMAVATDEDMEAAGRALVALGCRAALVTGGHREGETVRDCLIVGEADATWLSGARLAGEGPHGTGCVLSAAIAAGLALGEPLPVACGEGVAFVRRAIRAAVGESAEPQP